MLLPQRGQAVRGELMDIGNDPAGLKWMGE
jgi:hypothetical protein